MAVPFALPLVQLERFSKALQPQHLPGATTNLFNIRYIGTAPVELAVHAVPGDVQERPKFGAVVGTAAFEPAKVGHVFSPTWSTHWVKIDGRVPGEWQAAIASGAAVAQLVFDPSCEALVYTPGGRPLQGITGGEGGKHAFRGNRRVELTLTPAEQGGDGGFTLYAEVAAQGPFGADGALVGQEDERQSFALQAAHLALLDVQAHNLFWDCIQLQDIIKKEGPKASSDCPGGVVRGSPLGERAVLVGNAILNAVHRGDKATYAAARALAAEVLRPASAAAATATATATAATDALADVLTPRVLAVGHCHIDTAWLWPYAETRRKVARSWASQARYMASQDPDFTFAASQVAQWAWLAEDYPTLFDSIRPLVRSGRFTPVGASYVEPDGNMPSGEAFVRQFLYGAQWMAAHLGGDIGAGAAAAAAGLGQPTPARVPHGDGVCWLPDTFGYAPQLPAILRGCGMRYFLTQKLSWSLVNKPAQNTFWWTGLDGQTSVLTHFPPADSYTAQADMTDITKSVTGNKDIARSSLGLMLYGNGDGGGGPTPAMLTQLRRYGGLSLLPAASAAATGAPAQPLDPLLAPLPGMPRLLHATPRQFFDALAGELCRAGDAFDAVSWRGELFLELHNGTLTSQAALKGLNRASEAALHTAEALMSIVTAGQRDATSGGEGAVAYPAAALRKLWMDVLLCQFHDVLPGSSIKRVYEESVPMLQAVVAEAGKIADSARDAIVRFLSQQPATGADGKPTAREVAKTFGGATSGNTGAAAVQARKVFRVYNSTAYPRVELLPMPSTEVGAASATATPDRTQPLVLLPVWVPPYGLTEVPVDTGVTILGQTEKQKALRGGAPAADEDEATPLFQMLHPGQAEPVTSADPPAAPAGVTVTAIKSAAEVKDIMSLPKLRVYEVAGVSAEDAVTAAGVVTVDRQASYIVQTGPLQVTISKVTGHITSILDYRADSKYPRELVAPVTDGFAATAASPSSPAAKVQQGANRFLLFDDAPFFWDAWDTFPYSAEKVQAQTGAAADSGKWAVTVTPLETGPFRARFRITYPRIGTGSWLAQDVIFVFGSALIEFVTVVDWRESHQFLKVELPLALTAPTATFETQYGCVARPTHANTSRDAMMAEVCGHRWGDLSQGDYGVSLLNDAKYGYNARDNRLRLSLLRAPKAPDATCDMGTHTFRYAVFPHLGHVTDSDVLSVAANFQHPIAVQAPGLPVLQLPKAQGMMTKTHSSAKETIASGSGSSAVPTARGGATAAPVKPGGGGAGAGAGAGAASGLAAARARVGDAANAGPNARLKPGGGTKFRSLAFFTLDTAPESASTCDNAVLDTIKLAESAASGECGEGSGSGSIVVRLYEALGRHAHVHLASAFAITSVTRTNLLEEAPGAEGLAVAGGAAPTTEARDEAAAAGDALLASAPAPVRKAFQRHPLPAVTEPVLLDENTVEARLQPFQILTLVLKLA